MFAKRSATAYSVRESARSNATSWTGSSRRSRATRAYCRATPTATSAILSEFKSNQPATTNSATRSNPCTSYPLPLDYESATTL